MEWLFRRSYAWQFCPNSGPIVSLPSKRTTRQHLRSAFLSAGILRNCVRFMVSAASPMALSGCGALCGMAGGFGGFSGFGGNCGIGFPF
jgi:hypothetical protein